MNVICRLSVCRFLMSGRVVRCPSSSPKRRLVLVRGGRLLWQQDWQMPYPGLWRRPSTASRPNSRSGLRTSAWFWLNRFNSDAPLRFLTSSHFFFFKHLFARHWATGLLTRFFRCLGALPFSVSLYTSYRVQLSSCLSRAPLTHFQSFQPHPTL